MVGKRLLSFLVLALAAFLLAMISLPDGNLHLVACDVGQGDAILAVYKNFQILTDAGPGNAVLDCLGRHMPFWDKTIEVVVLTHPQKDHYEGLIPVLERYEVERLIAGSEDNSSQSYQVLKNLVGSMGVEVINPRKGMVIRSGLTRLDILSQTDRVLSGGLEGNSTNVLGVWTADGELNSFSIVTELSLGEFQALLTGDMPPKISEELARDPVVVGTGPVEYIKVPHHGSKNGLTQSLLQALNPKIAVVSVARNNSYGHPHPEILEMLKNGGVRILRTDEMGDVEVVSDGKSFWVEE